MASQFLTNSFLGPAYSLQVNSRSNHMKGLHARPSREGGLVWTLVPSPEDPGKYNICTTYKGKPKCLDIFKDDESNRTRVCLAEPGYYSGQAWTIIAQTEPGYYKLSNDWTGPGWYLDTYSDSYGKHLSRTARFDLVTRFNQLRSLCS